jgi:MFS transporter, SP family, galactose:H+ symporter
MAALRELTRYRLGFRIAVAAATIGVIYGYDLGNISGALLFITEEFDLTTKQTEWVATIVVAGSIAGASPFGIPGGSDRAAPVVAVVRAQQLALALARRRGLDPDSPEGLSRVTIT